MASHCSSFAVKPSILPAARERRHGHSSERWYLLRSRGKELVLKVELGLDYLVKEANESLL
jgi:hypothetical protein